MRTASEEEVTQPSLSSTNHPVGYRLPAVPSQGHPVFWRLRSSPAILKCNCRRRTRAACVSVSLIKESSIMAVPKRRMSRANTRSRRAQWKAKRPELVNVTVAGQQHKVPRRLLKAARLGLIDLDRS